MSKDVEILGVEKASQEFNKRLKNVKEFIPEVFMDILFDLLGESVRLAPVDKGDLRGSGYASINNQKIAKGNKEGNIEYLATSSVSNEKLYGEVGFTEPYALRQHEHVNYSHPQGGQAKYLEQPFTQKADKYIEHLKKSTKKAVE